VTRSGTTSFNPVSGHSWACGSLASALHAAGRKPVPVAVEPTLSRGGFGSRAVAGAGPDPGRFPPQTGPVTDPEGAIVAPVSVFSWHIPDHSEATYFITAALPADVTLGASQAISTRMVATDRGPREPSKLQPLQGCGDRDREPANSTTQGHDPCLAMGADTGHALPRKPKEPRATLPTTCSIALPYWAFLLTNEALEMGLITGLNPSTALLNLRVRRTLNG
jgi:hypothetical protein